MIREAGGQPVEVERLLRRAAVLVEQRASEESLQAHKVVVWQFLENGNSTTIDDADDRALRAALATLEPVKDAGTAADYADWVETVLSGLVT